MANKCCFPGCKTGYAHYKNGKNVSVNTLRLFGFPKDENLNKIWVKYINRKDMKASSKKYLCELHFDRSAFDTSGKIMKLKENAVPTVDFNIVDQSFTVITPTKGEHFIDISLKVIKLDFHENLTV